MRGYSVAGAQEAAYLQVTIESTPCAGNDLTLKPFKLQQKHVMGNYIESDGSKALVVLCKAILCVICFKTYCS